MSKTRPDTMKCVQRIADGEVKRVTNDCAYDMVATGDFRYVPKHEYKRDCANGFSIEAETTVLKAEIERLREWIEHLSRRLEEKDAQIKAWKKRYGWEHNDGKIS